jgi:hypothetical protein
MKRMIRRVAPVVALSCTAIAVRQSAPLFFASEKANGGVAIAAVAACAGDCGSDGSVTVDEIITLVNIALGNKPVGDCTTGNGNGDAQITVDEIIVAVNHALSGCTEPSPDDPWPFIRRGDVRSGSDAFARAVAANPNDPETRLYAALAHAVVRVVDSGAARDLLGRAGGTIDGDSRSICDLDASLPKPVPNAAPSTAEFLAAVRSDLIPEIETVLAEIRNARPGIQVRFTVANLPECVRPDTDVPVVDIDRGDLLAMESGLEFILFLNELFAGYNTNVPLHTLLEDTARTIIDSNPQLLTLVAADRLAAARDHLRTAMAKAVETIDTVRAETDNQDDDILVIDADGENDARKARLMLTLAQDALSHAVSLPIDVVTGDIDFMDTGLREHERLNLDQLFSGRLTTLRPLLPPFTAEGDFESGPFPDPTFGGIVPDMTQSKIDHFLEGGPPCTVCSEDSDCDALGVGSYYCGYCSFGPSCTGEQRRCSNGDTQCSDGTFY